MPRSPITRRTFLRAAGVSLALPLLEATAAPAGPPRRLVAVCTGLGLHAPFFFPTRPGADYDSSPYLDFLKDLRADLTICSGLSHPGVDGGHATEVSFLTAAPHPAAVGFRNSVSLDQLLVEKLPRATRFGFLALSTGGSAGLSWTRAGVRIPAESSPSRVYAACFLDGTVEAVRAQVRGLQEGRSILDAVGGQARSLHGSLGVRDRQKLDEYLTAVREVEQRLVQGQEWAKRPKPRVKVPPPRDVADRTDVVKRQRLMFDLVHLALQTDSTRLVTLMLNGTNLVPPIAGVTMDWHNLSHHGKDPEKIDQLKRIEEEEVKLLRDFLGKLKGTSEGGGTLLDRTAVLYGSNLGNASSHDTKNLPVLLAGGGFRHGRHLAFDPAQNTPLCNLFVSLLHRLGVEAKGFGSSTGMLSGLEMA
jgi:hypothetical protein